MRRRRRRCLCNWLRLSLPQASLVIVSAGVVRRCRRQCAPIVDGADDELTEASKRRKTSCSALAAAAAAAATAGRDMLPE